MKFDIVWEYCIQQEARVSNREFILKEYDQYIDTYNIRIIQSKLKKDSHKEYRPLNNFQRKREKTQKKYYSKYQCYSCHKIGYLARECPLKNKKKKIHRAHLAEDEDEEAE